MTTSLPTSPGVWPLPVPTLPHAQRPQLAKRRWATLRRWGKLSCDLGLDLGTSNTRIYVPEQGIVVQEPSVVAIDIETRKPIAYGAEALQLVGRAPSHIAVRHPIRTGNIADLELTEQMLRHWMALARDGLRLFRPRVVLGLPSSATGIDREALVSIVLQAGAKQVLLIDQPVAAALGAGLPIDTPVGHCIVDIGGGTTDVAVMSVWGTVVRESIPIAGEVFTQTIQQYIRHQYHLQIGMPTAEHLKVQLADPESGGANVRQLDVAGLQIGADHFSQFSVERTELKDALAQPLEAITAVIRRVLEQTPPELIADICDRGILLTGGGALLNGIEQLISQEIGILVLRAADPLNSVALGTGYALENLQQYDRLLTVES
ncbi:MAG: rod shape-determining protein [Thermosynechococcaceae cyanobacterium]